MKDDAKSKSINPVAIPIPDAARLLAAVGGQSIDEAIIRSDVEAGAPTNADGTLNLVHYAAWLVKQLSGRTDAD